MVGLSFAYEDSDVFAVVRSMSLTFLTCWCDANHECTGTAVLLRSGSDVLRIRFRISCVVLHFVYSLSHAMHGHTITMSFQIVRNLGKLHSLLHVT